jgi:hypothetical protein
MNITEIIAIKFQAHQHKHVTVHTTELPNRTRKRKLIRSCPILEAKILFTFRITLIYAMECLLFSVISWIIRILRYVIADVSEKEIALILRVVDKIACAVRHKYSS